jgi:hypothetical protein
MATYLTGTLLFGGWIDYKAASGSNLETKIDLIQFLYDTTASAILSEIQENGKDPKETERLLKIMDGIEKEVQHAHDSYEYILDNPALKSGINISEVSDKHNEIEKHLSKIVQELMAFQISQDMIDKSTIHEFYMFRRFGQQEGKE